jgi:hypothetical protein
MTTTTLTKGLSPEATAWLALQLRVRREGKKVNEMTRTTRARGGHESRHLWKRGLAASTASLALLGGAASLAPLAHADATDDQFVSTVQSQGFNAPANTLVYDGHLVCSYLANRSGTDVALGMSTQESMDAAKAWTFVVDSATFYCPSQLNGLDKPRPSHFG